MAVLVEIFVYTFRAVRAAAAAEAKANSAAQPLADAREEAAAAPPPGSVDLPRARGCAFRARSFIIFLSESDQIIRTDSEEQG